MGPTNTIMTRATRPVLTSRKVRGGISSLCMKKGLFYILSLVLAASPLFAGDTKSATTRTPVPQVEIEKKIAEAAMAMRDRLVAQRRDFHIHPELSNREERTSRVVAERLRQIGFTDVRTGIARYGVAAVLKGGRPGPVIAVRADMDALPIQETNDVPYKSQTPGVKHACGHDVHTTVELGVAEILYGMREQLPGTVLFIFQPAEEGPPIGEEGGAQLSQIPGPARYPPKLPSTPCCVILIGVPLTFATVTRPVEVEPTT